VETSKWIDALLTPIDAYESRINGNVGTAGEIFCNVVASDFAQNELSPSV
jgi:hypothetical protein